MPCFVLTEPIIHNATSQTMVTPDCGGRAVQQAVSPGEDRQVAVIAAAHVSRHGHSPAYDGVQHRHLPPHDACARHIAPKQSYTLSSDASSCHPVSPSALKADMCMAGMQATQTQEDGSQPLSSDSPMRLYCTVYS